MRTPPRVLIVVAALGVSCAANPDKRTLADLHRVEPDVAEVRVDDGLDEAMAAYKTYLEEAPESAMTPEALRRLADLKLEKEYGYIGGADDAYVGAPQPERAAVPTDGMPGQTDATAAARSLPTHDTDGPVDLADAAGLAAVAPAMTPSLPGGEQAGHAGPLEAIQLYDRILKSYPNYPHADWVLYQKARALDELGRTDEGIRVVETLIATYPASRYIDEAQFRRAEYFFVRKKFFDAEEAYAAVVAIGPSSSYYELALYKLGWTLYKQEMHEEALHQYVALLDHKVGDGYDFDQSDDESDERRIADTFRVISLSFSSLGGPSETTKYFATHGERSYENRIYRHLGEYYFEKLRYSDAAQSYTAFVDLKPFHHQSPAFSMRIVEIYEAGGFPRLVLESKKDFAARYGLGSAYWAHFDVGQSEDVLSDLKANIVDLANHYHALYQDESIPVAEKPANFDEALHWYATFIESFSTHEDAPGIHYRMADLLLEHGRFATAAVEYEHTAYEYPAHEQSAAAGYAAIYAYREAEKHAVEAERALSTRAAVDSTLRFVDAHPEHENAAVVLGAAANDLYEMGELEHARETGRRLVDQYDESDVVIRRAAWATVAHSNFDLNEFEQAEDAYARVLEMTPEDDAARESVINSLAAAIYKQGEVQVALGEHRSAAKHFLRVAEVAPSSEIRPVAEYDAGAAFVRLADWDSAGRVFEAFRESHPTHSLSTEATKQMALVYREQGDSLKAAEEYERVAGEATDPDLRAEALLVAGEFHEKSESWDRALAVYVLYVDEFADPLETAVETRFKIASLHERAGNTADRHAELRRIVQAEQNAGEAGTPRIRVLAGRSALVLAELVYGEFAAIELTQPFDRSLAKKKGSMNETVAAFEQLLDYEAADVTAAATFYMAEIYLEFSRALIESERPGGLSGAQAMDYEDILEEEAFPFEERSIEVHEKNLELLSAGVYNPWIEKSLTKLADLMPGRYAKFEMSSGLISSLDSYAYQRPNAVPVAGPEAPPTEEAPSEPVPAAPADLDHEVDAAWIQQADRLQVAG